MEKKLKIPRKGAGRKWAARLKELGRQSPPQDLVDKISKDKKKKVAAPSQPLKDLELE